MKFPIKTSHALMMASLLTITYLHAEQKIGTRQIHLDFHTSEHLPDVGKHFSKQQFQAALKTANVNAINIFGKGHHGWSYYPTKVGKMHPNLGFDLLGAQIEACHEIDVLAPIYFTFGWSHTDAIEHPEWCAREMDGSIMVTREYDWEAPPDKPKPPFHWIQMCANTGYHEHIMQQVEEICSNYDVDGFWFDIYQVFRPCYCQNCKSGMQRQGIDVNNKKDAVRYMGDSFKRHQKALKDLVLRYHPDASVYFNGCTALTHGADNFELKMYEHNTVQDLEDLPTTWGGYDKLPIQSKFFRKAGYPITAMSGKFHKAWGEFGGFKSRNALKYEAASMIAWGANCNFGDQLHPSGLMDMDTYRNIGVAYDYVEKIEDYGVGAMHTGRVGIWRSFSQEYDEGVTKMLLECHINFNVANAGDPDLSPFDVIIIPGTPCLTEQDARRLEQFVQDGGSLLVIGPGALDGKRQNLRLDIGADYLGNGTFDRDYLVVGNQLEEGLVNSPFLCYTPALRVRPDAGTEVLAAIREPYFSRTYGKFTSHQNTPYKLQDAPHPGVIKHGQVVFIAHELDRMYYQHGAQLHRDLFRNALKLLHKRPMVETELPSAGRVNLLHQPEKKRYIAHLLYGPPITRGACEVIEDLPVLYKVPVTVDLPVNVSKAVLVPAMKELPITRTHGKLTVTIPEFSCHAAVSFEYD